MFFFYEFFISLWKEVGNIFRCRYIHKAKFSLIVHNVWLKCIWILILHCGYSYLILFAFGSQSFLSPLYKYVKNSLSSQKVVWENINNKISQFRPFSKSSSAVTHQNFPLKINPNYSNSDAIEKPGFLLHYFSQKAGFSNAGLPARRS